MVLVAIVDAWQDSKEVRPTCCEWRLICNAESTLDPHGIMPSSAFDATAHNPSSAWRAQHTQPLTVTKPMPAPSMPRTMGRGLAAVRSR